jgi:uncharacterized membrane protein
MELCSNCGEETASAVCPRCGAASGLETRAISTVCYVLLGFTGTYFAARAPYNRNITIRFHAFQSIYFHMAWSSVGFAYGVLAGSASSVLHPSLPVFFLIWALGGVSIWMLLVWKAYRGERIVLPLVGPIAEEKALRGAKSESGS